MASRMSPPKSNKPSKKAEKADKKAGKKLSDHQNQSDKIPDSVHQIQTEKLSDSDLSVGFAGETVAELREHFEKQLNLLKIECNSKVDTLHRVLKDKDKEIGLLQREIGELKKTCDFLSDETSILKGRIKENEVSLETAVKKCDTLTDKTSDLEDRSRRSNLVFFNIPEPTDMAEKDDCENKVKKLIHDF